MPTRTARLTAAGLGLTALVLGAGPAAAHVSPDKTEVPAGTFTSVALTVGHGCDGSPTTQVSVQVPDGIDDVTPGVLPGWDIAVVTEPLAEPTEGSHGEQVTERESEVTFTAQPGSELADGFRQSFTLGFRAPDTPGEHLFFKTIQTCAAGETAWIEEYTGEGEEPEHPSPVVLVTDGAEGGTDAEASETDPVETDDSEGTDGLAVAGLVVGIGGLLTGGAALLRTRKAPSR